MKQDSVEAPETEEIESETDLAKTPEVKAERPLREVLKEETTLTPARVIITTLTAVSMAIISTKLTSVVNGMFLAGSVAVISAVVSEAYRVVTTLTAHGVTKAVAPLEKKNMKDRALEEAKATGALLKEPKRGRLEPLREYFARRKNMQLIALFSATAILTIGTSFVVTKSLDTPSHVSNNYPTQVKAEQLSEDEKQKIIDEAVAESTESPTSNAPVQSSTPSGSPSKDDPEPKVEEESITTAPAEPDFDVDDLKKRIDDLEKSLQDIQDSRPAPDEAPADDKKSEPGPEPTTETEAGTQVPNETEPEVTSEEVEELREEIERLKKQLEAQEEPSDPKSDETNPTSAPEVKEPDDTESPATDTETSGKPASSSPEKMQSDGGG